MTYVGRPLPRFEDRKLVTGRGRYAGDISLPNLLHLALCRPLIAHGHLASLDVSVALQIPDVVAVWTASDLAELEGGLIGDFMEPDMEQRVRPILVSNDVHYAGDPVAIVIAKTAYAAQDGASALLPVVDAMPAITGTLAASQPNAPRVHSDMTSNVTGAFLHAYGDIEAAFRDPDIVVRQRMTADRVCGAAIEPRAVTAMPTADGSLTVWTSTQAVFWVKSQIASNLGLRPDQVTVIADDVGGGFGAKGVPYAEEVLVSLAALRLGRPVKWVATRTEDMGTGLHGHGTVIDLELAADSDGQLKGLRGRVLHDIGAYSAAGTDEPNSIVAHMISMYRLPAMHVVHSLVYTNATPTGFIRGGSRPLGNFAIERLIDLLARRIGRDPVDVRRRNLIDSSQMPYDTRYPVGEDTVIYDSGDYPALLDLALLTSKYTEARQRQATGEEIGIGIACCVESTGSGGNEPARVRLETDGTARLWIGSTPGGQGHVTVASQLLADRLGWPIERIEVVAGDTRGLPRGQLTAGSRFAVQVGNAVSLTAAAARQQLLKAAADILEADPADLLIQGGRISVQGTNRSIPATEAIPSNGIEVLQSFTPRRPVAYASSCHIAVVRVDEQTGSVEILDYVIAHDSGNALNPRIVEGQLHGGFVHGLGYALFERAEHSSDGSFLTPTFIDYTIPSTPDVGVVPRIVTAATITDANPEGVKGVGESATIPVPAAVANAVEDALQRHHPGLIVDRIPLTPDVIYQILVGAINRGNQEGANEHVS